jgi:hypothetical protein
VHTIIVGSQLPEQQPPPLVQLWPAVLQPPSVEGTTGAPMSSPPAAPDISVLVLPELLSQLHAGKAAAAVMRRSVTSP